MRNFLKDNWFKLGILIVILLIGVSSAYYFLRYLPQNKLSTAKQNQVEKCFTDGNILLENYKKNNGTNNIIDPIFHYNSILDKCFTYVTLAPYQACESGRILFDVYENKEILTTCFATDGSVVYGDKSKYPVEIIDQVKFTQEKNQLLELQSGQ